MTRALFWEEAKPGNKVGVPGDQQILSEAMRRLHETFGRDPRGVELGKLNIITLRQMGGDVFNALADLVEAHGKIRVWGVD